MLRPTDLPRNRPVTTVMLFAALSLLGVISLEQLPVELLPEVVYPEIFVAVTLPGTSPEQVERDLVVPIEGAVAKLEGVLEMTSTAMANRGMVAVSYGPDVDMKFALLQLQSSVSRLQPKFPPRARLTVQRFDTSDLTARVMTIQVLSDDAFAQDLNWLRDFAEDRIRPELEAVEGVANAVVLGGRQRAITIVADPVLLQAHGLTLGDVDSRLSAYNRPRASVGRVFDGPRVLPVSLQAQFTTIDQIEQVVLKPEAPLLLQDVARVDPGLQRRTNISRINGKASVAIQIQKEDEANLVRVSEDVEGAVARLNRDHADEGIELLVTTSQADTMTEALDTLKQAAAVGVLLGLIVLYLFLRNLRFVGILLLAIPASLLVAFNLFYAFGLTINVLSLCGMALAVGMLADNSIVVMESIFKQFEHGLSPDEAVRVGTSDVSRAVVAATATTVIVFLPVVFIQTDFQDILTELALSITFPVLASLMVALLLVPALAVRTLHAGAPEPMATGTLIERYTMVLKACLRHRVRVTLGIGIALVGTLGMSFFFLLQQETVTEETQFVVYVELPEGATLEATDVVVAEVEAAVRDLEGIEQFTSVIEERQGAVTVVLKDPAERPNGVSVEALKEQLDEKVAQVTGVVIGYDPPVSAGRGGGGRGGGGGRRRTGGFSLTAGPPVEEAVIRGYDFETLRAIGDDLAFRLEEMETVDANSVRSDVQRSAPEVEVLPDVLALFHQRMEINTVLSAVEAANPEGFRSRVAFLNADETETPIDLRTTDDPDAPGPGLVGLRQIPVPIPNNLYVPLGEVARVRTNEGQSAIVRSDQSRRVIVQYRYRPEVNEQQPVLDAARDNVRGMVHDLVLPEGVTIELVESETDTVYYWMMGIAALLIYMVLASLFESLSSPLIIFGTLPTAVIGSCVALMLTETGLTSQAGPMALLGFVVLLGIAVNNGIILIDAIGALRHQQGFRPVRAVLAAGRSRVRPILMTSMTTLLGVLPLALEYGGDFEVWPPFAITVLGGLSLSMVSTLIFVPVAYMGLDEVGGRLREIGWVGVVVASLATLGVCAWIDFRFTTWYWTMLSAIPVWIVMLTVVWSLIRIHRDRIASTGGPDTTTHVVRSVRLMTLTKIYGEPGPLQRDWARFTRRAVRQRGLGLDPISRSGVSQSLQWKLPLFLLVVYLHTYVEDGMWIFVLASLSWLYVSHLIWCLSVVMSVQLTAARRYALPAAFFTYVQWRVSSLSVTIASIVLFLTYLVIRTLVERLASGEINLDRMEGRFAWLRRGGYRAAASVPLIGLPAKPFIALDGVDLEIEQGMFGLLGPNGAGKTTLMRILCQVLAPSYGSVAMNGTDIDGLHSHRLIGYLPQHFGLYDHLTAWQYLIYRALLEGFQERAGRERRVREILEQVNLLDRKDDPIGTFSGGMRQRVGIAQTLIHWPQVIVVDEPTAGLDPIERIRFRNLLAQVAQERVVVFSTHIVEDISGSCNRLAVLNQGRVSYTGSPTAMRDLARGKVWEVNLPESTFVRVESDLDLITHMRTPEGVRARFLSEDAPSGLDARPVDPHLEDAYVYLLRSDRRSVA